MKTLRKHAVSTAKRPRVCGVSAVWGVLGALVIAGAAGAQVGPARDDPAPWVGPMGVTETVEQIMERERAHPSGPYKAPFVVSEEHETERDELPQNPNSAHSATWPPGGPALV